VPPLNGPGSGAAASDPPSAGPDDVVSDGTVPDGLEWSDVGHSESESLQVDVSGEDAEIVTGAVHVESDVLQEDVRVLEKHGFAKPNTLRIGIEHALFEYFFPKSDKNRRKAVSTAVIVGTDETVAAAVPEQGGGGGRLSGFDPPIAPKTNMDKEEEMKEKRDKRDKKEKSSVDMMGEKVRGALFPPPSVKLADGSNLDDVLRRCAKDAAEAAAAEVRRELEEYGYGPAYSSNGAYNGYGTGAGRTIRAPKKTKKNEVASQDDLSTDAKGLGMPQPSSATPRQVGLGCAAVSGTAGAVLSASVLPDLWLAGFFLGGLYGYGASFQADADAQTAARAAVRARDATRAAAKEPDDKGAARAAAAARTEADAAERRAIGNAASRAIVVSGGRVTYMYLAVVDFFKAFWFMYKTGQLSYEYMQTYKKLDDRFSIQEKMDAWNSKFKEGKVNFDKWEKQNEVGRKILAGLRTVVLLDETSKSRTSGKKGKRYQLQAYANRVLSATKRFLAGLYTLLTGGGSQELRDVYAGMRLKLASTNFEDLSAQIGSAFAALVAVNLIGAFFSAAPSFLAFLACVAGFVWPNWTRGGAERIRRTLRETAEKGRGNPAAAGGRLRVRETADYGTYSGGGYNYFVRDDGTKRHFRVGVPTFDVDGAGRGPSPRPGWTDVLSKISFPAVRKGQTKVKARSLRWNRKATEKKPRAMPWDGLLNHQKD